MLTPFYCISSDNIHSFSVFLSLSSLCILDCSSHKCEQIFTCLSYKMSVFCCLLQVGLTTWTINHYTNKQENVNPLCLCSNWFQHQQTEAMVWKSTRNAFSNSVIKSSIHSVKVAFMGKFLSTVPE